MKLKTMKIAATLLVYGVSGICLILVVAPGTRWAITAIEWASQALVYGALVVAAYGFAKMEPQ